MSHDEHAKALARWLEQPEGTIPPDELDDDVVEAIVSLRPERAPAPRVTADDILALVTTGPLAEAASPGGEVVPFPGAPAPAPEVEQAFDHSTPERPPRWSSLARWGGLSGVGIALAAAATLMFVAVPTLQRGQAPMAQGEAMPAGDEMRAAPAAAAPAAEPMAEEEVEDEAPAAQKTESADAKQRQAPAARPKPRARPPQEPAAAPAQLERAEEAVYPMGGAPVDNGALIPELADEFANDGAADAEIAPSPDPTGGGSDLDALRAAAVPADWSTDRWEGAVSSSDRERVAAGLDVASEAARNGEPAKAADLAERFISPPDAAAHAAALAAVDHHLAAGNVAGAIAAARRGLQFRANTPGWSMLAVRLGDLVRSSDPGSAEAWYRDAAAQNATR